MWRARAPSVNGLLTAAYLRLETKYRRRFFWWFLPAPRHKALAYTIMGRAGLHGEVAETPVRDVQPCGHGAF